MHQAQQKVDVEEKKVALSYNALRTWFVCGGHQDSFIEIQVVFFLKLYILRHPNNILHRKSKFLFILLKFSARNISYLKEEKTLFVCPIFCKRWCTQRWSSHSDEVRIAMMYALRCCPKGLTFNDTDYWNRTHQCFTSNSPVNLKMLSALPRNFLSLPSNYMKNILGYGDVMDWFFNRQELSNSWNCSNHWFFNR